MKLHEYVDLAELNEMIRLGNIIVKEDTLHPTGLRIYNYSKQCQGERIWNATTERCRGLIVDKDDNIVARPFKKFYNLEEYEAEDINKKIGGREDFEAYNKLDGSLGILYWVDDTPYIATKGSFYSEQAVHATNLLHTKYRHTWNRLERNKTYLFEIIYPEDLHVVTYKDVDDIFLIGVLDLEAEDVEYDIYSYADIFPTTDRYDGITSWETLREDIDGLNKEGFVVKFSDGFRIKLKYDTYWTLHYIKAGFSEKKIFECLSTEDFTYIKDAMKLFDEEHKIYYNTIIEKYKTIYREVFKTATSEFRDDFKTRAEAASYYKTCTYPGLMFTMLDCKSVSPGIWKIVKTKVKFADDKDE